MKLEKLSASSLQSADMCMARYWAEINAGYGSSIKNNYARLGSSVHNTLEDFVKKFHIEKIIVPDQWPFLVALYKKHFMDNFDTSDCSGNWYDSGLEMLQNWYDESDFSYFDVISVEQKKHFDVQTSIGPIPVTYIIDRLDSLGEGRVRVVDYKTSNEILTPELLAKKIQARIYGLAIQIEMKDNPPSEIWVEFNMLRFKPVMIRLTREDNVATYRMLQRAAEKIIASKVDKDTLEDFETLNPQCLFCIRRTNCSAVTKNVNSGGIFSYDGDLEAMVNARALLEFQKKAAESAAAELETAILAQLEGLDLLDFETDLVSAKIGVSKRRQFDVEKIIEIIGVERFASYGGKPQMLAADFDKMCKLVSPAEAATLRSEAIAYKFGEPKIEVKYKGDFVK